MCRVTVVIPNYNGLKFMEPCMSALKKQTYTDFCVLIVDNGSKDGSAEWISHAAKAWPELRISSILLKENTGFAGAVNLGIEEAKSELILLLNNDTEPEPEFIDRLVAAFDRSSQSKGRGKEFFAASPKMLQLYNRELLDDAGDGFCLLGWAFQRGVGQPESMPRYEREASVFSACAGASMYKKELLSRVAIHGSRSFEDRDGNVHTCREYFDTEHFAYLEDLDLSFRARIQGLRISYVPDARVFHVGSGTSGSKYNSFKVRLAARNNVWLCYKNLPILLLLLNLPGFLAGILIKQLFFVKRGFGKDYALGFLEGIRGIPGCRKKAFWPGNLMNYVHIELFMLRDTFSYAADLCRRKLFK